MINKKNTVVIVIVILLGVFVSKNKATAVEQTIVNEQFKVSISRYEPKEDTKRLVIIVPPTGGSNFIDRSYARALKEKNITAVIIERWSGDDEKHFKLEIHDHFYRTGQRAIEMVVNQFADYKIGILGTSVGALHSSISFSRLKQIQSSLLIVGGAPIAELIVKSDQGAMVEAKEKRYKMYNFTSDNEYQNAISKILPYEPLQMEVPTSPKKLGMIISTNDSTVPTKNQLKLKEAWNPIFLLEYSSGHLMTIVKTWLFKKSTVINFFDQNL